MKFGEIPHFGEPLPTRVYRLVGSDRELLMRGYRCEKQGLGVGAFAYYRRIVEGNKDRFIDEMMRVAEAQDATHPILAQLERAKRQRQLSAAIESIKAALPESLQIEGRNPLLLLHRAASIGLHGLSDEECLAYARETRLVLSEFARKIEVARRDKRQLKEAVRRLSNIGAPSGSEDSGHD
ncbi:MAG: hypothetical protein AAF938_05320 [Myxococcota bacterium]